MAAIHIQQRKLAIGRIPQTAYGTQTAVAAGAFEELLVKDQNLAQYGLRTADNTGYSTTNDFPTDQWLLSHDVSRPYEMDLETAMVGRVLYGVMGGVATSQPSAGPDPTVYEHILSMQDPNTSRQLPVYSFAEIVGAGVNCLYRDGVFEGVKLMGEGINRASMSFTLRGSGKRVTPSGITWATHVNAATGKKYLFNSVCGLAVRDASTLANSFDYGALKRMESWSIELGNTLLAEDGYRPGSADFQTTGDVESGCIRSECLFGAKTVNMNFVIRLDSASDEYAKIQAQDDLDILLTLTGPTISNAYTHKLIGRITLQRYAAVEYGNKNGIVTLNITAKPLFDVAASKIIQFTLTNTTASYTT
jgi:hypothetical protein